MSKKEVPTYEFKLFDFQVFNKTEGNGEYEEVNFEIQMFGLNEKGETCSIFVEEYLPFFYIGVDNAWGSVTIMLSKNFIMNKMGKRFS